MWGSSSSSANTRSFDRLVGIFVTLGVVLSLGAAKGYVQELYYSSRGRGRDGKSKAKEKEKDQGDETFSTRWRNTTGPQAVHNGSCHCQRVRFRIRSSRTIYAVDVPSKVRFPRLSVPVSSFEALSDEAVLSMYAVTSGSGSDGGAGVGVHTFCSYCGVHVVYTPSTDPSEVQVNVDCLDKAHVDSVLVSYMAAADSVPVPVNYEPARGFSRRGTGSMAMANAGGGSGSGNSHHIHTASTMLSNLYALEGGSDDRYSSPAVLPGYGRRDGAAGVGWAHTPAPRAGVVNPYGSEDSQPGPDYISPFSKTRRVLEARARRSDDACSNYLDSYGQVTALGSGLGVGMGGAADLPPASLGPYGGSNAAGMYDNPMYRYSRDDLEAAAQAGKAAAATAPQWNQYYTGPGSGGRRYKESVDGDVDVMDVAAMVGQGFSFGGSFMSLTPSPMRVRSFLDHNAQSYGSPAGLAKQLDSMKTYLAHYPAPSEAPAPSLPTM